MARESDRREKEGETEKGRGKREKETEWEADRERSSQAETEEPSVGVGQFVGDGNEPERGDMNERPMAVLILEENGRDSKYLVRKKV